MTTVAAEKKKNLYYHQLVKKHLHLLNIVCSTCVCMSLTLCVDWLGGGAFLFKSASEMASYGGVSSFRMEKRGLSHRFLESGASNLSTNASKLQKTKHMSGKIQND